MTRLPLARGRVIFPRGKGLCSEFRRRPTSAAVEEEAAVAAVAAGAAGVAGSAALAEGVAVGVRPAVEADASSTAAARAAQTYG